jgi:GNAT superfamily N-acetyltransferase
VPLQIRPHRRDDADRIAEILAAGWRQAYGAFMPPAFLAPRSDPAWRRREIGAWLDEFMPDSEAVFVAERDRRVVGFIHMELGDKGELGATGVVNLLYVDAEAQGRGVGRALLAAGAGWLLARKPGPLALSAFRDNRFRAAYAAMGGHEMKQVPHMIEGREIISVLYLWPDPRALLPDGG